MRRLWATALALAFVSALLLFPGSSFPYWIQHSNYALDPAISPEQYRPAADGSRPRPGKPPLAVEVMILPLPPCFPKTFIQTAARAIERWDQVPGSAIRVLARRPGLFAAYDPNWFERWSEEDGYNTIEFVTEGWPVWWGPLVIAVTSPKLDKNGRIIEADIFCNAENYNWVELEQEGVFPELAARYQVDVEAILTHEMGHMFGLGHSQYEWACMSAGGGLANTLNRHLSRDDKEGLRALYPLTEADVPPPSIWGVHEDAFFEPDCKMSRLQQLMAELLYVYRNSPLTGPHDLIYTTKTEYPYCLYGSGFVSAIQGMDLSLSGTAVNAVISEAYISPNFVKAKAMNGAGGFPALATAAYDLTLTQEPGGTGSLFQGLFINAAGNSLPRAVIQPDQERAGAGSQVRLDGSGSSDLESPVLSYHWSVVESPGGLGTLSSDSAEQTYLSMPVPGIYVARLVVNDGTIDSIADQVVILAAPPASSSDDEDFEPMGCALRTAKSGASPSLGPGSTAATIILLILPLAIAVLVKKLILP